MLSMRPHLKQSEEVHRFSHPDIPLTLPPNGHPYWFPRGEWPTWSKPGKWHKWAMQLFVSMWHYLQWLFANMYIHHLITYSCTKSIKMLWGLFLPWPIYSYPSINNLVYYYTKVLLSLIQIFRRHSQIYPPDLSDEVTNTKFEIDYPGRPSDIPPRTATWSDQYQIWDELPR